MNNSSRQKENHRRQPGVFMASIHIFHGFFHWLAGFILLTVMEQKDAGIYLDYQPHR